MYLGIFIVSYLLGFITASIIILIGLSERDEVDAKDEAKKPKKH